MCFKRKPQGKPSLWWSPKKRHPYQSRLQCFPWSRSCRSLPIGPKENSLKLIRQWAYALSGDKAGRFLGVEWTSLPSTPLYGSSLGTHKGPSRTHNGRCSLGHCTTRMTILGALLDCHMIEIEIIVIIIVGGFLLVLLMLQSHLRLCCC